MVNVAVAGGTGGVGRAILDVISTTDKHQAFVLSRKCIENDDDVIQVDYNNIDQLVAVLEAKNIHTIICCFAVEGNSLAVSQLCLIQAAIRSTATRRFVPTAYAIPYPQEVLQVLPQLKDYFKAIELLKESDLQWTVFLNGIFLDYFGPPELKSHLKPNVFVLDMKNHVAAIPGDGNAPVTFTYSYDLARFVVAALDLEEWQEESRVVGDTLTWHEFVAIAEEICGCPFEIHYDSVEKLKRFQITELPGHRALYIHFPKKAFQWFMSIFEMFTTDRTSCIERSGSLNERFPEIQPLTVRQMLIQYWGNN